MLIFTTDIVSGMPPASVVALNATTGKPRWTIIDIDAAPLEFFQSSPYLSPDRIIVYVTPNSSVVAINVSTGTILAVISVPKGNNVVAAAPAWKGSSADGVVLVSTSNAVEYFFGYSTMTSSFIRIPNLCADGTVSLDRFFVDNTTVVMQCDSSIVAVYMPTLAVLWSVALNFTVFDILDHSS